MTKEKKRKEKKRKEKKRKEKKRKEKKRKEKKDVTVHGLFVDLKLLVDWLTG